METLILDASVQVQRTTDFFDNAFDDVRHPKGLFPLHITDVNVASLVGTYSFGGQADSYYEYLIKEHHLLGGSTKQYGKMYSEALDTAKHYLMSDVIVVPGVSLFTIGENHWDSYTPKLDHLTCFAGAMMALGSKLLNRPQDLVNADAVSVDTLFPPLCFSLWMQFTESCVWSYNMTQSGVGPESITFFSPNDESLFSKYEDEGEHFILTTSNDLRLKSFCPRWVILGSEGEPSGRHAQDGEEL